MDFVNRVLGLFPPLDAAQEADLRNYYHQRETATAAINKRLVDELPRTREQLQQAVRDLRERRGVIVSSMAADLIEAALALKE
jgi:ribosome-binding protein aMBF1 (putative translation factor)